MQIAIASGKGGTGKTMLAVSLAEIMGDGSMLVDLDVEEPNAGLYFFKGKEREQPVNRMIPQIDAARCTNCGVCATNCVFNALVVLPEEVMVFPELCHSCGTCFYTCPEKAVVEGQHVVGMVEEHYLANNVRLVTGRLKVGEAQSPPVIKAAKKVAGEYWCLNRVRDCPPGTGCATLEAIKGSDYCILVTEPTPFGHHDLQLALDAVALLEIPAGVVINRWDGSDAGIDTLADLYKVPILERIPYSRALAAAFASGQHPLEAMPELRDSLEKILRELQVKIP